MTEPERRQRRPLARRTMAEELADTLTEEIVSGERKPGDALPTEPELCTEFEVSRSVVRDAMRMLAARGLVSVQHGRGAFVSASQLDAFGEALLLALRREGASVWDVEEFFQRFWPEVFALAAERATDAEVAEVEQAVERYVRVFEDVASKTADEQMQTAEPDLELLREAFRGFTDAVLAASHNVLFRLITPPVQRLRSLRNWNTTAMSIQEAVELEASGFRAVAAALRAGAPEAARAAISGWFALPQEAVAAMKRTPVAETVSIPLGFASLR